MDGWQTYTIDLKTLGTVNGSWSGIVKGFRFDPAGRFTHLFNPRTGRSPALYRAVSVIAPTATEADALSTAMLVSGKPAPGVVRYYTA